MSNDRLYVVRLLWVDDPDLFAEYQEQAEPGKIGRGHRRRQSSARDGRPHGRAHQRDQARPTRKLHLGSWPTAGRESAPAPGAPISSDRAGATELGVKAAQDRAVYQVAH